MARCLFHLVVILNLALLLHGATENDVGDKVLPYGINCADGKPYDCDMTDFTPLCTVGFGMVFGHCGLKAVICGLGGEYDPEGKCLLPK